MVISDRGTVQELNAEAAAVFAAPAKQLVGRRFDTLFSADAVPAISALLALARTEPTGDAPPSVTVTREAAGGGASWVEIAVRRIVDSAVFFVIVHDVTADRTARARLTETANALDSLIAAAPVGLGFLSPDLTFVRVNKILAATYGLPPNEIIGRHLADVTPGLAPVLAPLFLHVARFGEPLIGHEVVDTVTGGPNERKTWLVNLYPVRGPGGEIDLVGNAVVDITPRQRAHEAMIRAVAEREQLLAVVSHDLRNPLASILLGASVLERTLHNPGDVDKAQACRYAGAICRAAQRMEHLIGDLLDFAAIRAGRAAMRRGWVPTGELFEELGDAHESSAAENGIRLAFFADQQLIVFADRRRLLQVLGNLIGNALKFTPSGGEIRVEAFGVVKGAVIAVQDTGPGVDPAIASRLFGAYERGNRPRNEGLGLGLFIARGIAEAHGGRLWLDQSCHQGARFCVYLPGEASTRAAAADNGYGLSPEA